MNPEVWISWAGNIASIVSLPISAYVLWEVRTIRSRFVRRFRVVTFTKQLNGHRNKLGSYVGIADYSDVRLMDELAKCAANLRSAVPHLNRDDRLQAQAVLALIAARDRDVRDVYIKVVELLQSLENAVADQEANAHVA